MYTRNEIGDFLNERGLTGDLILHFPGTEPRERRMLMRTYEQFARPLPVLECGASRGALPGGRASAEDDGCDPFH